MIRKLPKKEFDYIYSKVPRLCVDLAVKNSQGILLTLRSIPPWKNMWHLPGGTVLFGETLEQAVKRVAKEELGVEVKVIKSFSPIEWPGKTVIGVHAVSIPHLVKITKGKIKLNNQARGFKFFNKFPTKTIKEHKNFLNRS